MKISGFLRATTSFSNCGSLRSFHLAPPKGGTSVSVLYLLAALGAACAAGPGFAQPGTPGQPQPPAAIYSDSFQNRPGPTPIVKLNAYASTSGQTYSADPDWLTNCNGWIASANQPTDGATQVSECGSQNAWNRTQQLSWALGLHAGQSQAAAQGNYAVSAFTSSATLTGGQVEFRTATNIPFPTNNRFLSFSVDVAAVNCSVAAPLLQFSLVNDGGVASPAGSQINACTSGTTQNVPAVGVAAAGAVSTGTYTSNGAVLISGSSFGVRMVNNTATGVGNDHAFDNISVLDTTPQLDKEFGPTNVAVGGVSTLTFTITNTSELGSKTGWSFTDALPAGLRVASDETSTNCPSGVVTAPVGGSTIDVSGNLTAGMASCTATVPVTSSSAGTYTNDASNITSVVGVNPPGSTSVTFGTQPNFVCDSTMYFGIGAPTRLHKADTSTNPFTFPGIGAVYSPGYNAMGYDVASNYIYATRWDTTTSRYRLLRIGSDGSVSDQGPIVGGGINNGSGGIASGVIGPDGYYYVKENSTTNVMWRVDLTTRAATSITLNRSIANSDLAWYNGLIYTHDQVSDIVYSINPNTGAVTAIGPSGLSATAGFGSLISASNGIFGRYNSGGFYQFDVTTGVATLISDAPAGVGDGAKCPVTAVSLPANTQITKTDGSDTYAPGTSVTYTMVVSNRGPFGVQNASVSDPLPAGITEASWTCGSATNGGVCGTSSGTGAISDAKVSLPAGASVTFRLTLTVPTDFTGDLVNTATVTNPSAVPDPDTSNNSATDTDVAAAPALTVEKTGTLNDLDGDGLIDLGETISYSFLVRNTGNVTLTDVTVNDPLLTNAGVSVTPGPQTLAPSGSVTFTATYTPTQADIDNGQVENTATGTGTPPSGPPIDSPPDTVTVPPDQTPGMTIEKTGTLNDADGDGLIDLGETISYSFRVRNTGSVTLTNVTVDDPMLTNAGVSVSPGPQTLGPGGSVTFTATYTPTQADIDAGRVENTATGTGTPPSGPPIESPPDTVVVPPDQAQGMTVEKTGTLNDADGDGLIDLGETISYSFLVRNTGAVTLTNVTVDDPMLTNAGVSLDQGPQTLAPGATFTFTATYTPTQADIDAGRVENTATGTGTPPSGPPIDSPPDTVTVPPDQTPAMTIDKTGTLNDADGDGLIDLGETISYSFRVRNTGSVTLTNVTVDDPMLTNAGVSITPGPQTLAPGGTVTFTATYTPTQADIDAGQVENTATGTGTPPSGPPIESPPDTVVVPPDQTPGMTIDKTGTLNDADGDGLIDLGETISYSFRVRNTGTVTLTNVTVDDPMLTNAGVSVSPGPQTLGPGGSVTFTATYTPTQADIDNGQVENTATGTGTPPSGPPVESPPDTVLVPPDAASGMTIEKTGTLNDADGDGFIDLGETISYSFLVRNTGNVTLTNVTVDDPMLTNAGVSVSPGPQTLAPGGTVTFTATYTPTQADIDAGRVENTATGTGTPPSGPPIESPPDTVTVPPDQAPGMTIEKSGTLNDADGDGFIDLGETISYSFLVRNTGNVTLTNVTVDDPMLANAGVSVSPGPQTLGPGGTVTFTATYTPTQADIDAGRVENTATGTGTPPSGPPIDSPPDSVTVPPDQTPGMTIEKTGTLNDADGDGFIDLGETISYSFLVRNTGAVTLTNVTVDDPMLTNAGVSVSPGPQTLGPGGSVTFAATYTPTQADIDAGRVENTATGTGTPPSGPPVDSPPDTVTVPPDQSPGMTIEKTGTLNDLNGNGVIDLGETISYGFLVENTGAVTLTNVTVNDPMLTDAGVSLDQGPQTLAPAATFTFTATYTPTQADIDAGRVENTATGTGTPPSGPPVESPPDTVLVPPNPPLLQVEKTGRFEDVNGDGYTSVGDTLSYIITITNVGGATVTDVWPSDPGPTFDGKPAGGTLSEFEPAPRTLAPGEEQAFTATYTLTQSDVDNAAGLSDSIKNTATGTGQWNGGDVPSNTTTSTITPPAATPSDITVIKQAQVRYIRRGERAPYVIRVTSNSDRNVGGITVIDTMPAGFRYVEGSATIDGVKVTPVVNGLRLRFENITLGPNAEVTIRLQTLALSSAGPGRHINRASVTDPGGTPLAPPASATVEIVAEPVFDCGDVIGKVFDDINRNGYQDEGEPGLPGVRVATVTGWLITTDRHGRFHVACADLPEQRIGSNFIMKLDTRTLPTGYRLTTENPRVVRLTAGKATKLNFGASIGRVVRVNIKDEAFESNSAELTSPSKASLDQVLAALRSEQSILRLSYVDAHAEEELAKERIKGLRELIADRWKRTGAGYELEIETRIEVGE